MKLADALETRRSVRQYTAEPIADSALQELVAAATSAPSGGNNQPWLFVIVRDQKALKLLTAAAPGMSGQPAAVIVLCTDRARDPGEPGSPSWGLTLIGLGASMENLLLAAHGQGFGACAIGSFHVPSVRTILALPEEITPELLVAVGHPMSQPQPPGRRPLSDVCFFERVERK